MIEKLLKEAQEEATQKSFCDKEMGKSTKSKEEKLMKLDKLQSRIDQADATITELTEGVKTLEAEVAEIDSAQAEATKIRTTENEEYKKASKDFKDSAEAVARAIEVLKNYYEGAFIQVTSKTSLKSSSLSLVARRVTPHTPSSRFLRCLRRTSRRFSLRLRPQRMRQQRHTRHLPTRTKSLRQRRRRR